jgi:hypothetical protein
MRGHEEIAAARRTGAVPALVWVTTDGYNVGFTRLKALGFWPADWIEIEARDNLQRMDLRCVVGLRVNVSGFDERRVGAAARALQGAGAVQVIATNHLVTRRAGEPFCEAHRMTTKNEEIDEWPL